MRKWFAALGVALSLALAPAAMASDDYHGNTPAPAVPAQILAPAGGRHVALFCGLGAGRSCALSLIAAKARAAGFTTSMHSHWESPAAIASMRRARVLALIGHSAGADKVLAEADRAGARIAIAVDPTISNRGAPRKAHALSFYNPRNRIFSDGLPLGLLTFGICCGGAYVPGAENVRVPFGHVAMPHAASVQASIVARLRGLK